VYRLSLRAVCDSVGLACAIGWRAGLTDWLARFLL
jgi:hypothetical protein